MKSAKLRNLAAAQILLVSALSAQAADSDSVAYVTNQAPGQGGSVTVLDLTTFKPVRSIAVGFDPRGLAVTPDGRYLLTANQGDADVAVVDTRTFEIVHRIPVGKNVEFMRMARDGSHAFVTYEPSSTGGPPTAGSGGPPTADKGKPEPDGPAAPAEVAVIDVGKWTVVARMQAAPETEGLEFSPDGKQLLVANEGNDTIAVYDLATYTLAKTLNVATYGSRPRGIKAAPGGGYVVTLENSNRLLLLDAQLNPIKTIATATGPYGIAFDPGGRQLWVAASRASQIQVFDTREWKVTATIPVGQRCWHFSFLPGAEKMLLACGRSNALMLVDTANYKVLQTLEGYQVPWGVITYPKSSGSLDAP